MTYEILLTAANAIRKGGDVPYSLEAALVLSRGNSLLGPMKVPVRHAGTLQLGPMLRDPMILLRSPAAHELARKVLSSAMNRAP